jgi:glutathione S-transferase
MITVFGIRPAWGLPCVSPFVTKLVFWLQLNRVPFELRAQDVATLATDSPNGKLPYALLPDGECVADSFTIMERLARLGLAPLAEGVTPREQATMLAFIRMLDEHLYWHGVVEPRWVDEGQWLRYRAVLFGAAELPPPVKAVVEAYRSRIVGQWQAAGHGSGPAAERHRRAVADIEALEGQLDGQAFLLGETPRAVDAAAAAMLAHLIEAPFESSAAGAARTSSTLVAYLARVRSVLAG